MERRTQATMLALTFAGSLTPNLAQATGVSAYEKTLARSFASHGPQLRREFAAWNLRESAPIEIVPEGEHCIYVKQKNFERFTVAYHQAGRIHLCEPFFKKNARQQEVILLHEYLHVLGLPESPPSSQEITRTVERVRFR